MEAHHERILERHMDTLTPQQISNLNSHADAVAQAYNDPKQNHEEHDSTKALLKWAGGIVGVLVSPGMIWKVIKVIRGKK